MLEALVVAEHDYEVLIRKCPEFLYTVLYAKRAGTSEFAKLVVNRNISKSLQESVERILSNIHEIKNTESGIYLGTDGCFRQGILLSLIHICPSVEGLTAYRYDSTHDVNYSSQGHCMQ